MNILPFFLLGLILGVIITILVYKYKKAKNAPPSEIQLGIQKATIKQLQNDLMLLQEENEKLNRKLIKLKSK